MPLGILPEVVQPGTRLGTYQGIPVIAPACHDTNSAVVAVPATTGDFAYLSSGTWSLLGVEVTEPIITDRAFAANFTNEGGAYGTFCFLKNVMGLWLAQECRRTWRSQGTQYSWDELVALARQSPTIPQPGQPRRCLFMPIGDMPSRIREFCQRTGSQHRRQSVSSCAVYEAWRSSTAWCSIRSKTSRAVILVGCTSSAADRENKLLCQMTARRPGRARVQAGRNDGAEQHQCVQLITLGELSDDACRGASCSASRRT